MSVEGDFLGRSPNNDTNLDGTLKGKSTTKFKIVETNVIIDWLDASKYRVSLFYMSTIDTAYVFGSTSLSTLAILVVFLRCSK